MAIPFLLTSLSPAGWRTVEMMMGAGRPSPCSAICNKASASSLLMPSCGCRRGSLSSGRGGCSSFSGWHRLAHQPATAPAFLRLPARYPFPAVRLGVGVNASSGVWSVHNIFSLQIGGATYSLSKMGECLLVVMGCLLRRQLPRVK